MIFHKKRGFFSRMTIYGGISIFSTGIVLLAAAYLLVFKTTILTGDYAESELVIVRRGYSYKQIINTLYKNKIIKYKLPIYLLGKILKDAKQIKPGRYRIPPNLSAAEIINYMATRQQDEVEITIKDGMIGKNIAKYLEQKIDISSSDFMRVFKSKELLREYNVKADNFEGYFTPNTYRIKWASTAEDVIRYFLSRFRQFYTESMIKRANQLKLTENEVLTLASIVDAETDIPSEYSIIASVYWNRLYRGMKLQADPTVLYAIGEGNRRVLFKDLSFKSPYNTYLHKGLPPGPINSPSFKAIQATLYPQKTPYLYFVAKGNDGTHRFARNEEEHLKNVKLYRTVMRRKRAELRRQAKLKNDKGS